jgi:AcrR family transcriptional regulator
VPRLWTETIETHRREVRDAILDTTAALVAEHGLLSVTMSQIAEETGIGRATLYKYFPTVEAVLVAWHERQINQHLHYLASLRDAPGTPGGRLAAVLQAYALISHGHRGSELEVVLHAGEHVARAQQHLTAFIEGLLADAAQAGDVRDDIPPGELASYCLHALQAAGALDGEAAIRRLVSLTLAGLRPAPHATQHTA